MRTTKAQSRLRIDAAPLLSIIARLATCKVSQGSHRLEKYLNFEGFLEKSLKIKHALKSTGKSLKNLEKPLNSIFCRT